MEVLNPASLKKEKVFIRVIQGLFGLVFLFAVWSLISIFRTEHEEDFSSFRSSLPQADYLKIGKGPMALSPKGISPALEPVVQDLVLMGKNTRPDFSQNANLCLGLKTSGAKKELISGQNLYLLKKESGYEFSEASTDIQLTVLSLNGKEVLVRINGEEVVLSPSSLFNHALEDEIYVQALKQGKTWAPDIFLSQWGGEEYRLLGKKNKIEIGGRVYFLAVGETLWWDGEEWQAGEPDPSAPLAAPLAQLTAFSESGSQLEVWNGPGFDSSVIEIPLERGISPLKADETITAVRPRAPGEITCQLGKRRVIVKEGDWWVKTERRWRPLRTVEDLEAFLHHKIQGELFVFEKIEQTKNQIVLKGKSFDKTRSQTEPLALFVNTEKKSSIASHKKQHTHSSAIAKNKIAAPVLQQRSAKDEEGR